MGNYFTLSTGNIIVKGECDFVIDEYTISVNRVCRGERKTYKGFHWKHEGEN